MPNIDLSLDRAVAVVPDRVLSPEGIVNYGVISWQISCEVPVLNSSIKAGVRGTGVNTAVENRAGASERSRENIRDGGVGDWRVKAGVHERAGAGGATAGGGVSAIVEGGGAEDSVVRGEDLEIVLFFAFVFNNTSVADEGVEVWGGETGGGPCGVAGVVGFEVFIGVPDAHGLHGPLWEKIFRVYGEVPGGWAGGVRNSGFLKRI